MVDTDTFLMVLDVMADDFYKRQPPHHPAPGPEASLTESEVITLVIFSQWARFRSERDFYRYAASRQLSPPFLKAASSTGWPSAVAESWRLSSGT